MSVQQKEPFTWTNPKTSFISNVPSLLNTPDTPINEQEATARPYVCHQCNQAFSRTHNLKSHLTIHSSEKPFQCPTCSQYFRRQHDLKRHQKLHTGERPFKCNKCFRSFARLDALTRHQRSDGGTACNTVHNRKSVSRTGVEQPQPPTKRPLIPQISIPNPSTQPHILTDTMTSSPPSTTSPNFTSSPTSMESKQLIFLPPLIKSTQKSPPPFRSWSYPSSSSDCITLPSLPNHASLQLKVRNLEEENALLKLQVEKMSTLKARVRDLEIENQLLKSTIEESKSNDVEIKQEPKKFRFE